MVDGLIARIEREAGVADLVRVLAERLTPSDLQSLLLEVYHRQAAATAPRRLVEQYETNRFVVPSPIDPRRLVEVDRLAWRLLPDGYAPIELSPLCPLGTNAAVASVSQHKVVSTIRNTEVVSDSTNVMALACASRRRRLDAAARRRETTRLAASHRLTRAQALPGGKGFFAHFRVISMVTAGRDEGALRFESRALVEQIGFYVRLLQESASIGCRLGDITVKLTDFSGALDDAIAQQIVAPLAGQFPGVAVVMDPTRTMGRGYYDPVCFKLYANDPGGDPLELGDGGVTDWTAKLLSDRKERLVVSGLGVERLCGTAAAT